jgi:hypothetical protein
LASLTSLNSSLWTSLRRIPKAMGKACVTTMKKLNIM